MSELYYTANGGGATTVALVTGNLSTLSSHLSDVLVVAGGGGGGAVKKVDGTVTDVARGGDGGGVAGADPFYNNVRQMGLGGTQTSGYAFGAGQAATATLSGGGAGLYGGWNTYSGSETPAFTMNTSTGNDSVRYDSSDIVISESGVTVCHGAFGDVNSLSNPYATFADGVWTIVSYGDGARGWVYDTSVSHNIIPPNCILYIGLDIQYVSGSDFELYFSDYTEDRRDFEYHYQVKLDYGDAMPQRSTGVWYSTEFVINMIDGILQNYNFYVNDAYANSGILNQHMVNVNETDSIPCSIIGIKVPSTTAKIKNFYINWEVRS